MAAKFFTGLPLDGPDPECVTGHGEDALNDRHGGHVPQPSMNHSKPVKLTVKGLRPSLVSAQAEGGRKS